ncbi:MAG TPA: DUF433 domain-containing protein [Thermomicrobiales bacterium]|nr:DUF433 domain-containing protein [Thermomicrobiales bacterium]
MTDSLDDRIQTDPAILSGKHVIAGTRLSVTLVANLVSHGYDVARVVQAYPSLTPDDVAAALASTAAVAARRQPGPEADPD